MKRMRTVWRFSSPGYDLTCRIDERSDARTAVTVTENGFVVERTVFHGGGRQTRAEAWHEAVALHEKHHERAGSKLRQMQRPERERDVDNTELQRQLLPSIHRLEQSRERVLRDLDSLESGARSVVTDVKKFRAAWEILDLEHQFLTGRSLSAEQYRRQLRLRACPSGSDLTGERG